MPYLVNNGIRIHYGVYGNGRPVVLLHGGTVSFEHNYAKYGWIERLNASGLQAVGLDFRGHGESDKPHDTESYGTSNLADDVRALLDHLKLVQPALIAYSIGTVVALHLLQVSPPRFNRAALVATGDGLVGFPPYTLGRVLPPLALVLDRTEYPNDLPHHLANYWNFVHATNGDREALRALSRASYPPLSVEQAAGIGTPVLVVSGEMDLVLGQGQRLAGGLGQGTYFEVPGADHFSLAADADVQAAVVSFITAQSPE
ncbi:MAG TPA: alpha/beta fold hydrolase [Gammaproteobacteria bacterium]|nr:alpha/beta fold hydrolase [Gammaproteobacteria bacterium]